MAFNSKPTVPEVLKWMKDLNDWFSVGEKIGVRFSKLRALEDKYPTDAEKAREEVVTMWLERDTNPTWARLADAFEYAGQRALARKIRETYNCPRKPQLSKSLAQRGREMPKKPPDPPLIATTSYPQPPPSPPPSPPPYRMSGKSFDCSCHRFALPPKQRAPEGTNTPSFLPFLRVSVFERFTMRVKLKQEGDEMIFRLGGFVNRILRSFKTRSVSVPDLVKCLSNFGALPAGRPQIPLLQHRMEQLKSANTLDEGFLIISDYISFFNHALLEHLVKELGSDDDREELDTFLVYFEMFAKRAMFEVPPYMYGYMWLKTEMLVVLKTEEKWVPGDYGNIKGLYDFLHRVCGVLKVLPHALHMCRVDQGSVVVVCRMPPHVVDEVFPLSSEQEKELVQTGVAQLHCVEYCFRKTDPSRNTDSSEVATSDFMSLEEDNFEPLKSHTAAGERFRNGKSSAQQSQPAKKGKKGKKARQVVKKKKGSQNQDLLMGQLKTCCHYHEQMSRLRNQSCTLVTAGDMGYDGDSETSSEDTTAHEVITKRPIRNSRKRLKWRLAHAQF